jgi:hypothetical protein
MNWWEVPRTKEPVELKDDTPFEIKTNPLYKKMVGTFL